MHKLLNLLLVAAVLVSGFILYSLEHTTRGLEREASKFRRGIAEETENMRLLNAEWSSLTRPDRLRALGDRRWELEARAEGQVVADAQRLTQAVVQLAANAGVDAVAVTYGAHGEALLRERAARHYAGSVEELRLWLAGHA